jgi:hypothetical protein
MNLPMATNTVPVPDSQESSPTNQQFTEQDTIPDTQDYVPGQYTAWDFSPNEFVELTEDEKKVMHELVIIAARTNVASRRFEVEQAWEARLFERSYQHLVPRRGGGWSLPGEGSKWGPLSTADSSALYSTNTYGRDKDIIVSAMSREVPEIQFFPQDIDKIADIRAAKAANKYKRIYEKNNDLRARLAEIAYYFYTDDRALLYTRLVLDGQKFGFDEGGNPKGREITSIYGKLEGKVPMEAQYMKEMQFIQLYRELDVAIAKCRYPWVAKDIRPGSCGIGEIELDKIARVNTKLALLGSYVTGDAMMREVTEQYSWFRPEMFYDEIVNDDIRASFLQKFPTGCLVIYAGQTFVGARAESMDDHLVVAHGLPGIGQNRRALGTNGISLQKRLNAYLDIMDDFFKRTIPRRHYDSEAFDVAALSNQNNTPGGSGPFQRQPGVPVDQLVFVEPTPQPQPSLPDFVQLFFNAFPESLSGALPSIFGGDTGTETVGGAQIQRDAALGRIGVPWASAHAAFNEAARQAVLAAADRSQVISAYDKDTGNIQIDPDDLRGSIVIYPEYDSAIPESFRERETRYTEIVTLAPQNPFFAELLKSTKNMRAIAQNIRMADLTIPGEESAEKALGSIEILKNTEPLPNPQLLQMQQQVDEAKIGMMTDQVMGVPIPPEAEGMFQQLEQAMKSMPQEVPSVAVAQDESENHAVEAQAAFEWLNSDEGVSFKGGIFEQQRGFQNVFLFWQSHAQLAKKFAPHQPTPLHFTAAVDKLPPDAETQVLANNGITTAPPAIQQKQLTDTQHKIAQQVVPKTVPAAENITITKMKRAGQNNGPQQPPPK